MSTATGFRVQYDLAQAAWRDLPAVVLAHATTPGVTRVCEVGAGARPMLGLDVCHEESLEYTVLDISAEELIEKAPEGYRKVQADIAGELPRGHASYDLVFSRTLAEHVRDAERFHRNVYDLLAEGGVAVHMFPTLFAPAFIVNLLLPASVSRYLLTRFQSHRRDVEGLEGKFPAYYRWCRGPSPRLRRLTGLGYEVVEYRAYFGTPGYYRPLRLAWLDDAVSRFLCRFPVVPLTSYALVVLRRPRSAAA